VYTIDLSGKVALVTGVANKRSLAWGIAQELAQAGAKLLLTYQGERVREYVEELAGEIPGTRFYECDVSRDESLDAAFAQIGQDDTRIDYFVHSIAFAQREDLGGKFFDTSREGFHVALDISSFSLLALTRRVVPFMHEGGSIVSLSYIAAQRAVPSYNVMGTAKAALEQMTRQLAMELGPQNIRVNCISAGPVSTLSARGVSGFTGMLGAHRERAPLQRNITQKEVGTAGLFLLSDLGSGVTGEVIFVDAGYHVLL
jgi:enoyl-[acyl-carrier protein] reductase I